MFIHSLLKSCIFVDYRKCLIATATLEQIFVAISNLQMGVNRQQCYAQITSEKNNINKINKRGILTIDRIFCPEKLC